MENNSQNFEHLNHISANLHELLKEIAKKSWISFDAKATDEQLREALLSIEHDANYLIKMLTRHESAYLDGDVAKMVKAKIQQHQNRAQS